MLTSFQRHACDGRNQTSVVILWIFLTMRMGEFIYASLLSPKPTH